VPEAEAGGPHADIEQAAAGNEEPDEGPFHFEVRPWGGSQQLPAQVPGVQAAGVQCTRCTACRTLAPLGLTASILLSCMRTIEALLPCVLS
jgi:hypothetical protein